MTLDIYKSFDWDYDTKGVFLDIFREFDKVWHKGKKQTSYINKIQTCFKWAILFISRNWSTCSTSFYKVLGWTIVFYNIHKRLIWWFSIQSKITCRWYICILCGRKYVRISWKPKQCLSQNKWKMKNEMENEIFQWKMNLNPDPNKQAQ